MKRLVLFCFLAVLPATAIGQPSPVPFTPPDAATLSVEVVLEPTSYDRPSQDRSTQLEAFGSCSRSRLGGIDVTMLWRLEGEQKEPLRVDVSRFRDGFRSGAFLTSGERPKSERGLVFTTPEPGIYYFWRLLSLGSEGWIVRGAGRVEAPVCPVDGVKE